jgi:hypothetical protein
MRKLFVLLVFTAACGNSVNGASEDPPPGDTDIDVVPPPSPTSGSAQLSWEAPTETVEGTALTLEGYRVYYGTSSAAYSESIDVGNVTTTTISDLASATYYFAVTAYDTAGNESTLSGEVSALIE